MILAKAPGKKELLPLPIDTSKLSSISIPLMDLNLYYTKGSIAYENIVVKGIRLNGIVYIETRKENLDLIKLLIDGYDPKWWRIGLDDIDRRYIEKNIIEKYSSFDPAHDKTHVHNVIRASIRLSQELGVNPLISYIAAAYHDIGLIYGREDHNKNSSRILKEDEWIKNTFNQDEIDLIAEACEDHRASSGNMPRSIFGLIVADSDREIDPDTVIKRTIKYSLASSPGDRDHIFRNTLEHLAAKYSSKGYVHLFFPSKEKRQNLIDLASLIAHPLKLKQKFDSIYDEIKEEKG